MEFDQRSDVAVLVMNEGKANSIGPAFLASMEAALDRVCAASPSALVLTGEGKHFCAGLDLAGMNAFSVDELDRFLLAFERAFLRLFLLPFPVVAAVNGNAIAGGCILAGAADYRVAALGEYRIGVNEVRLGVSFPSIALEVPRFQLPPAAFARAVLEGDLYPPAEAAALGLVDELVSSDRLLDRASEVARRYRRSPREAFAQVKREMRAPAVERIEGHGEASRAAFRELWFGEVALKLRTDVLTKKRI